VVSDAQSASAPFVRREVLALGALCVLGCAMTVFVAAGPWIIRTYGFGLFIPAMAASGLLTIAAAGLAPALPARVALPIVLAIAIVMRLLLVTEEPFLSTDIYRYVWDGRVQGAGINPYLHVPASEALAALRDNAIYPNINRADYAVTAYPPVAQMFFLAVTRVSETLVAMRLALVLCEAIIVAVIIDLLRLLRLPATAVVAWAWHPLAIWEIASSGHVDALMLALLMLGLWLAVRHRRVAGTVAVALATLTKPYAAVLLPLFWKPWDWRAPLAAMVAALACYLPYLGAGAGVLGFVASGYLAEEGFSGGDGFWLVALTRTFAGNVPGLTLLYLLVAVTVMGGLVARVVTRAEPSAQTMLQDAALLLMAGLFFVSPNYAWYVLAVVPFTVLGGGAPAWALSLAAILLYRPLTLPDNDLAWKSLATLPFVLTLAGTLLSARLTPSRQRA
jgi:alpha-1,6-mannosyltransferase